LIELGENTGVARGRNIGMQAGTAPYIISIDNDAYFEGSDVFERVEESFLANRVLGAISFRIGEEGTGVISKSSWPFGPSVPYSRSSPCLVAQFGGAAHAIRREALEQTAQYDEKLFFYWEELDLSYQLINAGYVILYDPGVRVIHAHSPTGRMGWRENRYYYLVRNGLYVRFKYDRSYLNLVLYAAGYLVRGLYNRVARQALQGVRDALKMVREFNPGPEPPLTSQARNYIWEHNLRGRGNLPSRFFREAFSRLPE
jgi:GT2 family glycosyltransferase